MLSDSLETLIINLDKDNVKRENISKLLAGLFKDYGFIKAVYGPDLKASEYYQYVKNDNPSFGERHILTPSEVGCFLSHKKALKKFIETSDKDWLLVLEDDVSSTEEKLMNFLSIDEKKLPEYGIYILGGQDGLLCEERFILSPFPIKNTELKKIILWTERWLFRTCCYLVHKKTAVSILKLLDTKSFIIDDWRFISKNSNVTGIYYSKVFSHPLDLSCSLIEMERKSIKY
ncbi:glycosyltransferase family 25 protein [Vibrio cholerae]|uniref:glycosyltransferase family 25 protein n=1 Tax=Vibrio cholerae TaxID=666 RepID=UPI0011DA967D|nr:glycosyltransferase family 25 protein [Vibrio cholerae]EGR1126190.1 glycosyltransferase family 25 protein [Vibrio cholerae]EGR4133449.1 glycosyltransferase family 25 protein [Vibrio cholerae]EKG0042930.1 glycosyltransferase family 25 protein [Vibrio cholerae]ELR6565800.1 glycosyltransferase family 25 protein [Vibrio cholerae]MCX9600121.1 glycosyltransferase family 25 protein [Vibrio cholerae]